MVRTKSSEQAKRLAAKLAAAEGKPPPAKPAKPEPSNLHFLGDPRPSYDPPNAEESAEDVARAKTIAQTRKGAVVAATLCRTNFTEGLQGTSQEVVDVLGEGGLVPRKGWLGCMVPDVVRESEHARFEIKEPKLPRPLRTAAIKPVATEQDQDSPEAPAPTRTAGPAASEGDGGERAVPRSVQFLQWGRPVGGEDLVITDCTDSIIAAELQRKKKKQAAARRPDGVCRSPNGVCQRM